MALAPSQLTGTGTVTTHSETVSSHRVGTGPVIPRPRPWPPRARAARITSGRFLGRASDGFKIQARVQGSNTIVLKYLRPQISNLRCAALRQQYSSAEGERQYCWHWKNRRMVCCVFECLFSSAWWTKYLFGKQIHTLQDIVSFFFFWFEDDMFCWIHCDLLCRINDVIREFCLPNNSDQASKWIIAFEVAQKYFLRTRR